MEINNTKEATILRTVSLHSSPDVVHIESVGYDRDDVTFIEYDAKALIEDIPSLYAMAKQAIEQGRAYETERFVEFRKILREDYKGKRGRKKL